MLVYVVFILHFMKDKRLSVEWLFCWAALSPEPYPQSQPDAVSTYWQEKNVYVLFVSLFVSYVHLFILKIAKYPLVRIYYYIRLSYIILVSGLAFFPHRWLFLFETKSAIWITCLMPSPVLCWNIVPIVKIFKTVMTMLCVYVYLFYNRSDAQESGQVCV